MRTGLKSLILHSALLFTFMTGVSEIAHTGQLAQQWALKCSKFLKSVFVFNDFTKRQLLHPVLFVGQVHYVPGALHSQNAFEKIAASQFKIAQYILKTQNPAVFVEGKAIDVKKGQYSSLEHMLYEDLITSEFKDGFPVSYLELSQAQKELLVRFDAAIILFAISKLDTIYGTETASLNREANRAADIYFESENPTPKVKNNYIKYVKILREEMAISRIGDFIQSPSYKGQTIILIFGAGHQFERFPNVTKVSL